MISILAGETGSFANPFGTLAYGGQFDPSKGYPTWDNGGRPSHGAGAFQDEPSTYNAIRAGSGISAFDPQSQIKGNWWYAQKVYRDATGGRSLEADLKTGALDPRGQEALYTQWNRGFMRKYVPPPSTGSPTTPSSSGTIPVMTSNGLVQMTNEQYATYTKSMSHLPDPASLTGRATQPAEVLRRLKEIQSRTSTKSIDLSARNNVNATINMHGGDDGYTLGGAISDAIRSRMVLTPGDIGR